MLQTILGIFLFSKFARLQNIKVTFTFSWKNNRGGCIFLTNKLQPKKIFICLDRYNTELTSHSNSPKISNDFKN